MRSGVCVISSGCEMSLSLDATELWRSFVLLSPLGMSSDGLIGISIGCIQYSIDSLAATPCNGQMEDKALLKIYFMSINWELFSLK